MESLANTTLLSTRVLKNTYLTDIPKNISIIQHEFLRVYQEDPKDYMHLIEENSPSIVTSKNGVSSILPLIQKGKKCYEEVYCVGENTALNLALNSIHPKLIALNAKGLAHAILEQNTVDRINYFCGNLRRSELIKSLTENNIDVYEIQTYKVRLYPKEIKQHTDGILFYSPSGVRSYFRKNTIAEKTVAFVIGSTTETALNEVFSGKIITADQPKMNAVLQKALEYFS